MASSNEIKANVLKLQNANATPQDIENYVKMATQESGGQSSAPTGPTNFPDAVSQQIGNFTSQVAKGMDMTGIPQIVGGAAAVPAAVIGGVIGAGGNVVKNLVQGNSFGQGLGSDIVNTAKDTAQGAYQMGKGAAEGIPLMGAGKAINAVVTAGQGYQGGKDIYQGIKSNNPEQIAQGTMEGGMAGLGAFGLVKGSDNILPDLKGGLEEFKGNMDTIKAGMTPVPKAPIPDSVALDDAEIKYREATGQTPAQARAEHAASLKASQYDTEAPNPQRFLAQENVFPDHYTDSNGTVRFNTEAQRQQIQGALSDVNSQFGQLLDQNNPAPRNNLIELKKEAVNAVTGKSAALKLAAQAKVAEAFDAEITANGGPMVSDSQLNTIKQGLYDQGYNESGDPTKRPNAAGLRQAGHVVMQHIIDVNKDTFDVDKVNKLMQQYIAADDFLAGLDTKPVPKHSMTRLASGVAGAIGAHLALKTPVLADLIGFHLGEKVSDMLNNPDPKFNAIRNKTNGLIPQSKSVMDAAQSQASTAETARSSQKLLGPGALRPPAPPDVSRSMSQEEANAYYAQIQKDVNSNPAAIRNMTGKSPSASIAPMEGSALSQGKDGSYYLIRSGYSPAKISSQEANELLRAGYLLEKKSVMPKKK